MRKLNYGEIQEVIKLEDRCGMNTLLQEIFAAPYKGIDVFEVEDGMEYVIKEGTTLLVDQGETDGVL